MEAVPTGSRVTFCSPGSAPDLSIDKDLLSHRQTPSPNELLIVLRSVGETHL